LICHRHWHERTRWRWYEIEFRANGQSLWCCSTRCVRTYVDTLESAAEKELAE
jgi:hypothetical protein